MAVADGLVVGDDGLARCWWPGGDPGYIAYHDTEWGRPVHDDVRLYEKLCLEGFQSGLSWLTILRKREAFRSAFAGFDPTVVAGFGDADVDRLLGDAGIIRHRGKITAAIANAGVVLDLAEAHGSFASFVWGFAPDGPRSRPATPADVPATTPESTALARALKRAGARFVGPTTAYAFMQAMGRVDDHLVGCHVPPVRA
ncbi:DNA-3-methyladenine glycosylase I [Euzebya sp.]|uniref:DNA-3-methyladenine glycosylase I n=1 Tax=Euzebya sp. TaxID=1971409 RepID=UPI00351393B2